MSSERWLVPCWGPCAWMGREGCSWAQLRGDEHVGLLLEAPAAESSSGPPIWRSTPACSHCCNLCLQHSDSGDGNAFGANLYPAALPEGIHLCQGFEAMHNREKSRGEDAHATLRGGCMH